MAARIRILPVVGSDYLFEASVPATLCAAAGVDPNDIPVLRVRSSQDGGTFRHEPLNKRGRLAKAELALWHVARREIADAIRDLAPEHRPVITRAVSPGNDPGSAARRDWIVATSQFEPAMRSAVDVARAVASGKGLSVPRQGLAADLSRLALVASISRAAAAVDESVRATLSWRAGGGRDPGPLRFEKIVARQEQALQRCADATRDAARHVADRLEIIALDPTRSRPAALANMPDAERSALLQFADMAHQSACVWAIVDKLRSARDPSRCSSSLVALQELAQMASVAPSGRWGGHPQHRDPLPRDADLRFAELVMEAVGSVAFASGIEVSPALADCIERITSKLAVGAGCLVHGVIPELLTVLPEDAKAALATRLASAWSEAYAVLLPSDIGRVAASEPIAHERLVATRDAGQPSQRRRGQRTLPPDHTYLRRTDKRLGLSQVHL